MKNDAALREGLFFLNSHKSMMCLHLCKMIHTVLPGYNEAIDMYNTNSDVTC